jgi:hypothetical protein
LTIADTPTVPLARRGILDDHVDLDGELLQQLTALLGFQVESDGELVAHLVQELPAALLARLLVLEHVLLAAKGSQFAQRIAAGRFDLNDLGAQLCELRRAPVSNVHAGAAVQHANAGKCLRLFEVVFLADD